jgi:hypothetical protein
MEGDAIADSPGPLPNALIVGAARSGTTSLAFWLENHPQVFLAQQKEVHFFDDRFELGEAWYRSRFAGATPDVEIVCDATPTYMFLPEVPARMKSLLPGPRLIAILRDPVDRAYSHYWMRRLTPDVESRSFETAIGEEFDAGNPETRAAYVSSGYYLRQIHRVLDVYPRDLLHIVLFDDLRSDPLGTFADVCRFLEIDQSAVPAGVGRTHNQNFEWRSLRFHLLMNRYRVWARLPRRIARAVHRMNTKPVDIPELAPATRRMLAEHYAPFNAALGDYLGRDLSSWGGT